MLSTFNERLAHRANVPFSGFQLGLLDIRFVARIRLAPGAIGLVVGLLTQWAALVLILIMFGAICKKAVEWKTGFWGEKSMGWHYDVLFIAMLLVIVTTGGGELTLMH